MTLSLRHTVLGAGALATLGLTGYYALSPNASSIDDLAVQPRVRIGQPLTAATTDRPMQAAVTVAPSVAAAVPAVPAVPGVSVAPADSPVPSAPQANAPVPAPAVPAALVAENTIHRDEHLRPASLLTGASAIPLASRLTTQLTTPSSDGSATRPWAAEETLEDRQAAVTATDAATAANAKRLPRPRDPALVALASLRATVSVNPEGNPFVVGTWVPAPPPAPVVIAAPVAPPPPPEPPRLPFKFVGALDATKDAPAKVFLSSGERLLIASTGDVIDSTYRIDSLTENAVTFTYLPMNKTQSLPLEAQAK